MTGKRRHPFIDLTATDLAADLPGEPALFLGRFDRQALGRELAEAGVFEGLAERGYEDLELRMHFEGGEHRLLIVPAGESEALVDLRLVEAAMVLTENAAQNSGLDVLSVLSIHWLQLQDPRAAFTAERPRLPGQSHPGLGVVRPLITRIHGWARAWGKDALANVPAYFHNACLYAEVFRFVSPERQGRFEALQRDLAALSVAAASAAIDSGAVIEDPGALPFRWEAGDMVAPLTDGVRRYLEGDAYQRAAAAARAAARFRLRS